MTTENNDLSVTTFNKVVVLKQELLETLQKNREKHNSIYDAAVSGYWIEAKNTLEKKESDFNHSIGKIKKHFESQKTELGEYIDNQEKDKMKNFSIYLEFNSTWPLVYPENHLEDYDRVIDMLKFSVANKVELSSQDFDAYVRNNWSWRKSFLSTNSSYGLTAITGCFGYPLAASGCVMSYSGMPSFSLGSTLITGAASNNAFTKILDSSF